MNTLVVQIYNLLTNVFITETASSLGILNYVLVWNDAMKQHRFQYQETANLEHRWMFYLCEDIPYGVSGMGTFEMREWALVYTSSYF